MNFKKLLKEKPISYYYMGLIVADGCFSLTKNNRFRFNILLHKKDKIYLEKLAKYISYTRKIYRPTESHLQLDMIDDVNIPKVMDKFDLKFRKTYNPPNNLNIKNDILFLSFLIGYIDGDGCILKRKRGYINLKCHSSWKICFSNWVKRLYDIANQEKTPKIKLLKTSGWSKDYLVFTSIANKEINILLKNTIEKYDLPVFKRKWDRIDVKKEINYKEQKEKTINLLKSNKKYREIFELTGLSFGQIGKIKKQINPNHRDFNKKIRIPILQLGLNGDFIREFPYPRKAYKELNIKGIYSVLNRRRKTAGGYIWKYKK